MNLLSQKLITCILPKGIAVGVVERLNSEHGIMTANIRTGRGMGKSTPRVFRGLGAQSEKEILTVLVPAETADELFEFIYDAAKIDRPHGGLMYIHDLTKATAFVVPDVPADH